MATRRVWIIEELEVDGNIAHRQSVQAYTDVEETGDWHWDCPEERLAPEQKAEWDRIMDLLSNVGGEDFRHVVCAQGLMDFCFEKTETK